MSPSTRSTLLIVDDNITNLKVALDYLQAYAFELLTARSGEAAVERAQTAQPDLILLDVQMPGWDGFETCRRLKADPRTAEIPVIFMTALTEVEDKVRGFEAGGVDYVTKPFQIEEMLARIRAHLNLRVLQHALEQQNQQLHEQNRELEAFAHTVAHDLKNPVAGLVSALEFLPDVAPNLTPEAQEIVQLGINAAYKLENIIDELLLLASVRKEAVPLEMVEMGPVVEGALARLRHLQGRYQPTLHLPADWPRARGYAPWLEEVWANYLSNAMKYGGQPPVLWLGATPQPNGRVRFWVRDNGVGLNPDVRLNLFTEFTRLAPTRAQGHGLGLSIVRRILDKLGGQCGIEAPAEGGSEFYFVLPGAG